MSKCDADAHSRSLDYGHRARRVRRDPPVHVHLLGGRGSRARSRVALAALAIAGPLFGGVAAWKMRRWSPLALGSSLGLTSILAMALIVRLSY